MPFTVSSFDCAGKFLKNGGHMILYSNEGGFVKKQLRRHMEYRLLDEFCIREKEGFYLFIVGKRGNKNDAEVGHAGE